MANDASGGGGGGGGGEEVGTTSALSSPRTRVKFLCSYGGKILPRLADGHLKYVGGETRVIAIPRDINFSELMKKLSAEFEGGMVLKYQVMPEDLDVLVTVRTNEDLKHMFDEHDRHESEGTPKLRAFLFPANPVVIENPTAPMDPHAVEQRYVDAINGMVRMSGNFRLPPINANRPTFSMSACSSPKSTSPESNAIDSMPPEFAYMNGLHSSRLPMNRVHSSPSLYSLNNPHHQTNQHIYQHHHHYHQQHHPPSYQPPRPSHDHHRLLPSLSLGWPDLGRAPIGPGLTQHYSSGRHNMGNGSFSKYGYYDEHSAHGYRTPDRSDSVPQSPRNKITE